MPARQIAKLGRAIKARLVQSVLRKVAATRPVGDTVVLLRTSWKIKPFDLAAPPRGRYPGGERPERGR